MNKIILSGFLWMAWIMLPTMLMENMVVNPYICLFSLLFGIVGDFHRFSESKHRLTDAVVAISWMTSLAIGLILWVTFCVTAGTQGSIAIVY